MELKSLLAVALCAAICFTAFDASARVFRRYSRYRPRTYRPPAPHYRPPARPVAPKTLQVFGRLYSFDGPGRSLMLVDDNTRSLMRFVVTPQTKFIRNGQHLDPSRLAIYERVVVTYQDTDATAKEIKVAPLPAHNPQASKPQKK